jgi:hybrid polyketide synthase/nonribosomal peptide synthetase ACE1
VNFVTVRFSYVLEEDPTLFDAGFFGVKPVEAIAMDPQQRILLETVYEALEAAGIPLERIQGSATGVFVGLMTDDYTSMTSRDHTDIPSYFASGTARSIISNRVSFCFDLRGPSVTIDTACSSSLVALHQAVLSLRSGESTCAIVCGANLLLSPENYIASTNLKMLSPSGRSKMWDKSADGYGRGDGFGVLVVKTLSKAVADNDDIECIIRGTGVNQDGRTKGLTMPSSQAQAELIKATYEKSGLDLSKASNRPQYFEAHGTGKFEYATILLLPGELITLSGTPAGDPIEAEAISTAFFGNATEPIANADSPLFVGSIKTIIGHSEGSAGVAGVLKASLALQNQIIPANLLLQELNPAVKPFSTNLRIPQQALPWPFVKDGVRRASVNSFGFGGTNSHAILESFTKRLDLEESRRPKPCSGPPLMPFTFSAASVASLKNTLTNYADFLRLNPTINLRDLSWTLNTRRSTLPVRTWLTATNATNLASKLETASRGALQVISDDRPTISNMKPKLLAVFTGQGAQWAKMGAFLLEYSPKVRDCLSQLQKSLDTLPVSYAPIWTLEDELLKDSQTSNMAQSQFSQPLCTAVQIILVDLFRAARIELEAVVGHSSGEIAAGYAAGYISAADAIRIAFLRGLFLKNLENGSMLAVGTSRDDALELCELPFFGSQLHIAATNSPSSVTLSGKDGSIQDALEIMVDEKKFARKLKVDRAYHSPHIGKAAEGYLKALRECEIEIFPMRNHGNPDWISSVTGESITRTNLASLSGTYWCDNMVNEVAFSRAIEFAASAHGPFLMCIEMGPHPALKNPVVETISAISGQDVSYIGTLYRGENDIESIAGAFGTVWEHFGHETVNFENLDSEVYGSDIQPAGLVKGLPTYSWTHDRSYMHETRHDKAFRTGDFAPNQLIGIKCPDEAEHEIRWKNHLKTGDIQWLSQHRIHNQVVFPAAGYISAVVEAVAELYYPKHSPLITFSDVIFPKALFIPDNGGVETLLSLKITDENSEVVDLRFDFYSNNDKESNVLTRNASGSVSVIRKPSSIRQLPIPTPLKNQSEFLKLDPSLFYAFAQRLGYGYQGAFQGLYNTSRKMDTAIGNITSPTEVSGSPSLLLHPGVLDSAIQSILLAYCYPGDGRLRTLHVPTRIERFDIDMGGCLPPPSRGEAKKFLFRSSVSSEQGLGRLYGDVTVLAADACRTIFQLQGLHATPLVPFSAKNDVRLFFEMSWRPDITSLASKRDSDSLGIHQSLEGENEVLLAERVALYYIARLRERLAHYQICNLTPRQSHYVIKANNILGLVSAGLHPTAEADWLADTKLNLDNPSEQ